jgi:signal transduction histidine kinase
VSTQRTPDQVGELAEGGERPDELLGIGASGYAGPGRRKPVTIADIRTQAWRIVGGVCVGMSLWAITAGLALTSPASQSLVISLSHGVTGALLLASAALALAVWRITGTSRAACAVVGLSLAGLASPVMGILSRAVNSGDVRNDLVDLLAALLELIMIACVAGALLLPPIQARLRPLRIAGPVAAACILSVAAILTVDGSGDPSPVLAGVAAVLRAVDLALWVATSVAFIVVGFREQRHSDIAIGIAVLLPAAGAIGRMIVGTVAIQTRVLPTGFALAVACLIAGVATVSLWRLHTWHGSRLIAVAGELRSTRTEIADLESDQARRLHDARNAIFAIAGATELLAHPAQHDGLTPDHLQRLISAELERLSHLLDPGFRGSNRTFTTTDLLDPLVAAYRARGVNISTAIDPVQVHGRRELLVGVITNILTNARVHAPGAHIWLSARATGYDAALGRAAVRIVIADDGPGIPPDQHAAVLLPGVRGSHARTPGLGLGLASAVQALSEVGGTLRLSEREGGGTVVTVTIPKTVAHRGTEATSNGAHIGLQGAGQVVASSGTAEISAAPALPQQRVMR